MFSQLLKSRFLKSAGTISGGAAAAQLIAFGSAPFLTRLYSPESYGVLALMLAFVTIGIAVGSLHYELAIALPARKEEAASVCNLVLTIGTMFSLLIVPLVAPRGFNLFLRIGYPELAPYWWLFAVTLFGSAVHQGMTFWHLRQQRYKEVAANGLIQSLTQNVGPIALGAAGLNSIGLILGLMLSRLVAAIGLIYQSFRYDRDVLKFNKRDLWGVALHFKSFPTIGLLGAILHVGVFQLPAFLLTNLYGPGIAGLYMLQERVMGVPLAVLGQGMSSVFYVNAAKLAQENVQELRRMYFTLLKNLSLAGAIPALGLLLFAPWLFGKVFGPEWRVAGEFAQIMVVPTYLRFVAGPLFRCLTILRGQMWILICDGLGCMAMLMLPTLIVSGEDGTAGVQIVAVAISLTYAGLLAAATLVVCRKAGVASKLPMTVPTELQAAKTD